MTDRRRLAPVIDVLEKKVGLGSEPSDEESPSRWPPAHYKTVAARTTADSQQLKDWLLAADRTIIDGPEFELHAPARHRPYHPLQVLRERGLDETTTRSVGIDLQIGPTAHSQFDPVPVPPLEWTPSPSGSGRSMWSFVLERVTMPLQDVLLGASKGVVRAALRLQQGLRPRSPVADAIGPVLSIEAFAAITGQNPDIIAKSSRFRTALAIRSVEGELYFPIAQLSEDGRTLPGLAPLLRDLPENVVDSLTLATWMAKERPELGNRSAWDRLRESRSYPLDVQRLVRRFRARASH